MEQIDVIARAINAAADQTAEQLAVDHGVDQLSIEARLHLLRQNRLLNQDLDRKISLASGIRLLDAEEIAENLSSSTPLDSFEVFQSLGSTNSHLLDKNIQPGRTRVCLTEAQVAGRGRRGNQWQSAPYRNIMLSMSWGFSAWPDTITGLGLAVALVVAEELNSEFELDVKIKWPNDLMVGDDKLAGILIDVSGESGGDCSVVIGLGLNVDQPDWSQQTEAAYRWQDLSGLGVNVNRNLIVAKLINALVKMLREFETTGFTPLTSRWNSLSSFTGRTVRLENGASTLFGCMSGVGSDGALLITDGDGEEHRISDSNLSVRLAEN